VPAIGSSGVGWRSKDGLVHELRKRCAPVQMFRSCLNPRKGHDAIFKEQRRALRFEVGKRTAEYRM